MYSSNATRWFFLILITSAFIFLSTPGFSADKSIGKLTDFSGTVLIKSQGSWAVEPRENLPLYSGDKVVTREGTATITFNDGAVMEIRSNSNLMITEREEEKGIFKKVKFVERRLRLILGKLIFRTGRSKIKISFETPTAVCGIRGTAGTLSIGADGQPYIYFSEGGAIFTIGDFISGVAEDVPAELADLNPAQRAAFVAAAAADQAKRAAEKAATGEISQAQAALALAQAAEAAADEVIKMATEMLNNASEDVVAGANEAISEAEAAKEAAKEAQQDAIDAGAEPGPAEPYEPPEEPGFDVPVEEEPPIQDTEPASPG